MSVLNASTSNAHKMIRINRLENQQRNWKDPKRRRQMLSVIERGNELRASVLLGQSTTLVLLGHEDVTKWSTEELKRGRKLAKNGKFTGLQPKVVPMAIHEELTKRLLSEATEHLQDNLQMAVEALTEIVNDDTVDPKDRLKGVDMIMNRIMGKTPERVKIEGTPKWQKALDVALVGHEDDLEDEEAEEPEAPVTPLRPKAAKKKTPAEAAKAAVKRADAKQERVNKQTKKAIVKKTTKAAPAKKAAAAKKGKK